jgi:hypothetical protein
MHATGRRHFLGGLAGGTLVAGLGGPAAASTGSSLADRLARATLSMQRAAWEQGVAAQAFLERGDMDMVVLFARDAALRTAAERMLE